MKNLDLNSFCVEEINTKELKKTDGGFIPIVIFGWVIGAEVVKALCVGGFALGVTLAATKSTMK